MFYINIDWDPLIYYLFLLGGGGGECMFLHKTFILQFDTEMQNHERSLVKSLDCMQPWTVCIFCALI